MTDKIKVLAICHEDPELILGGMGMHVRELYRSMAGRGDVEIDLLTTGPGEGSRRYLGFTKYQNDKLVCWKPRHGDLACLLFQDIQLMRTLAQLLAQGRRWDVIHSHEWGAVQVARMARDALNVPLVSTMHLCMNALVEIDAGPMFDGDHLTGKWSEGDLYMRQQEGHLVVSDPDELILCSQAYVDLARKVFMTERPINMVHNGIDTRVWHPYAGDGVQAVRKHSLSRERPIALYVGRIAEMKGIRPLLDAVEATDSGYQVVLVGEVNANSDEIREKWDVTQKIRALEKAYPERLKWLGFNHGQDLFDLYAAAQVVLMPSIHEPFGLVALEAMAMGVPLISTEVDGLGEIVCDGADEYAMIIPPNSPQSILQALLELKDDAVRDELASLGLKRARHFTWKKCADQTVDVYRKAIEQSEKAKGIRACL